MFSIFARHLPGILLGLVVTAGTAVAAELQLHELPRAGVSAISGVTFPDQPKQLPIDTRFSQAIQTVAFDLDLTCRQIEAYGWTLKPSEQNRVDAIFTGTASELTERGYMVKPRNPASAAEDITVYTATMPQTPEDHVLFMWSAGDAGLLLLTCDAKGSGEAPAEAASAAPATGFPDAVPYVDTNPTRLVGEWMGRYTCRSQGITGATLTVTKAHMGRSHDDHRLEGVLSFYPMPENPGVARGSYRVMGTYDDVTQQAFFSPGQWLQQPAGYITKPFIVYFDTQRERMSAIFQDTTGCTSFEAGLKTHATSPDPKPAAKKPVKKKKKKKAAPKPAPVADEIPPVTDVPATTENSTDPVTVPETTNDSPSATATVTDTPPAVETSMEPLAPAPAAPTVEPSLPAAPAPASAAPVSSDVPAAEAPVEPVPAEIVVPKKPGDIVDVEPKPAPPTPDPAVDTTTGGLAVPPAEQPQPAQ